MTSSVVIDRARKLRLNGSVDRVTPDETWVVRSDSGQTYAVMLWYADLSAIEQSKGSERRIRSARCTCPAGTAEIPCHHALAVLAERS